ncbi:MAG: HEPN domain-containing protein [Atribacterota bacterium]|nr:HEPN domain-containing protein [Atribacterota bacterium]
MRDSLIKDYLQRAQTRIEMLDFLKSKADYADVVREAREVVELLLKALFMGVELEVPRVHEVSKFIEKNQDLFPESVKVGSGNRSNRAKSIAGNPIN